MSSRFALIIVAAGQGQRFGAPDKVLVEVAGLPAIMYLLNTIDELPGAHPVVLVTSEACHDRVAALVRDPWWQVVQGGDRRQDSVAAGLASSGDADIVVVHDGARPFASTSLFEATVGAVEAGADAALAAIPLSDTLKRVDGDRVVETLDRTRFALAQTPQAFRRTALVNALRVAEERGLTVTDEATLVEQLGGRVVIVPSALTNLKLTNPEDRIMAEAIVAARQGPRWIRTGIGYDVHRLVTGRRLVLGGVVVPHDRGLDGHSDADVLVHAIMDALLGAAALGDIGRHFPPTDPAFKDADSVVLLYGVRALLATSGSNITNLDATVIAEAPRLLPFVEAMRTKIASALGINIDQVGIKATTNEGMGFPGRGEGIAALAVATISGPG